MDRGELARFLRHHRDRLQPEDVGLPRGQRRRTSGLRREEVASLCHMSTDYYARLETGRGPQPSEQILASIAHGLALTPEEHKHLLLLAGHRPAPRAGATGTHIPAGLARILDRLDDTPAEIVTEVGQTLRQTPMGVALLGDLTHFEGLSRNLPYRWFTGPEGRARYAPDDHERLSRLYVSGLREVAVRRGPGSPAAQLVEVLLRESQEFRDLWELQEVGLRPSSGKRFMHPDVGLMELECQT